MQYLVANMSDLNMHEYSHRLIYAIHVKLCEIYDTLSGTNDQTILQ